LGNVSTYSKSDLFAREICGKTPFFMRGPLAAFLNVIPAFTLLTTSRLTSRPVSFFLPEAAAVLLSSPRLFSAKIRVHKSMS